MEQWTEGPENWVLLLPQLCNLGHVTVLPWASVSLAVEHKLECIIYVIFMWSFLIQSSTVWGPLFPKSVLLWPSLCLSPDPRPQISDSDVWFCVSRFSLCPTSSRPRRHSPCLPRLSGRKSFHLWTLLTGTITTTWCRCRPPPELFYEMTADSKFLLLFNLIRQ